MPDPMMYRQDHFVILETNQPEQFVTAAELLTKLEGILADRQDQLPRDLQNISTIPDQAQHLLDTACELDMGPDNFLQWYAVRLEK